MKILISGSGGLIGTELVSLLTQKGHSVTRLVRSKRGGADEVLWNPIARIIDPNLIEGFDAVIHLAGDPIAQGRWSAEKKARIRDSRIRGTRLLAETLARLKQPPKVLLCASAVGIYGSRGDEVLTEESPPGSGFLAEVGQEWEKACEPAGQKGIRVVNTRFGMVLSPKGGALKKMLPPFRLGIGGRLGSGRQWMSWISLPDVAEAILHLIQTESARGPINVTSPNPVTNRQFTQRLARALHRPAVFPVPAFALRLLLGEMADELLLASTRVEPKRLKATGYRFRHPELEPALRELL